MHNIARRRFLKFLAASPLLSSPGLVSSLLAQDELIASPDLALDVFDFEAVARHRLPPAHFGYMATGVDDDATLRANREGFGRYQLYPTDQLPVTRGLVKRAEAAGCPVLVLTVDLQGGSNRISQVRAQRRDSRQCSTCHLGGPPAALGPRSPNPNDLPTYLARQPMFSGLDVSGVTAFGPPDMNWDFVKRLRDMTTKKLVVKGIVTKEDAALAAEHGVDAIVVSNHGGRAEDSGRGTIESLPEVIEGVAGRGRAAQKVDQSPLGK